MNKNIVNNAESTDIQTYNNLTLKSHLINKIYEMIDLAKFKYKLIETVEDIEIFDKHKYNICANYAGINCLLIFTKIKDNYYSFMIDRKTLSYNFSQINMSNVNIIPVKIQVDQLIYDGSIFDGILIQNSDKKTFVINDVYYLCGKNTSYDKLNTKILSTVKVIGEHIQNNHKLNNINLTVNKLYDCSQIKKFVYEIIPKSHNFVIKGIAFYPEISGTKLIYLFDKTYQMQNKKKPDTKNFQVNNSQPVVKQIQPVSFNTESNVSNVENINDNNKDSELDNNHVKKTVKYNVKTDEVIFATFQMRKTDTVDVYKLYLINKEKKENRIHIQFKKIDIAYIPTIDCSLLCKEFFKKNTTIEKILVKCKFIANKNKWQPIEEDIDRKYPDSLLHISNKIDIFV